MIRSRICESIHAAIALAVGLLSLCACNNVIYDGEGDCSITYRVKFKYDYNMKYADAFPHEVKSVTLYVIDDHDNIVWQKMEEGDVLAKEDYAMKVDVAPGTYRLLAWCGDTQRASFQRGNNGKKEGLTATLSRRRDENGEAHVMGEVDRLYYGTIGEQVFPETEGSYTYTVPLMKNTNNIRVVLRHLGNVKMEDGMFTFRIVDDNGFMTWNNDVPADEKLTYHAWNVESGSTDVETEYGQTGVFTSVAADFTTARLLYSHSRNAQLVVSRSDTGATVISLPLIDALLLVKGFYERPMDDQEYLDRQDEYALIFFLDSGLRWTDQAIFINSWKVVWQKTGL